MLNTSSWRSGCRQEVLHFRAKAFARIRQFMAERQILEVDTPALSRTGNTDPNIESLITCHEDEQGFYLHTSPEFAMKRLLAEGTGDIYQLGHVFRAEELGKQHQLEFCMLEWYRLGMSLDEMMTESLDLATTVYALAGREIITGEISSHSHLFKQHWGVDYRQASMEQLQDMAQSVGFSGQAERKDLLDLLTDEAVRKQFKANHLNILHSYPPEQAALARLSDDGMSSERFELFAGHVELANAYHELLDGREYQQRFEADNRERMHRGQQTVKTDEALCQAMLHGMPECCGIALGVDRLIMCALGLDNIKEVIPFAHEQQ